MSPLRSHYAFLFLHVSFFLLLLLPPNNAAWDGDGGGAADDKACSGRYLENLGGDSLVCVCDAEGCPTLLPPDPPCPTPTTATTFTTSRGGQRFKKGVVEVMKGSSSSSSDGEVAAVVEVAVDSPKQVMNGFGGALTDSAALTMSSLSPSSLDALLRVYFSPEGLEYTLLRVPIAGCDFSLTPYTYADTPPSDGTWNFGLVEEDIKYKLPLLRRALGLARRSPKVLASPWSAPAWMKDNKKINESGILLREHWQHWADYIVKFIEEYEDTGVPIWGISTQNHPFTPVVISWNSMFWTPDDMRDWIKTTLGPTLSEAGLGNVKVYAGDENRNKIEDYSRQLLNDHEAARYITGIAVHWYDAKMADTKVLDETHLLYPSKDILYTEACIEPSGPGHIPVLLGSWSRAERYATSIIETVNHYASGWIDWNICLDMAGGPNWKGNYVDAPVIINEEKDEFYLQPIFFVMGHFSKFVPPGSVAVPSWVFTGQADHLHSAAFTHPDGHIVLQLLNMDDVEMEVRVEWDGGTYLHTLLPPRSLQTLLLPWDGQVTHEKRKYHSPEAGCEETGCH